MMMLHMPESPPKGKRYIHTAAYEAAFALLPVPGAFVVAGAAPPPARARFALRGLDAPLAWPLHAHDAAQIAALYPDKIVPAVDMDLGPHYMDAFDTAYDDMYEALAPHWVPWSTHVATELSHMVVDDIGDASAFRLRPSADSDVNAASFGSLIVLLPSSYSGGLLVFAHDGISQSVDACGKAAYAAALLSTTITSARITSGYRAALVYRLYHADANGATVFVPPAPDAAIAAFQALSRSTTEPFQRLGRALTVSHEPLSFASLGEWNQAFIAALVASGAYDVGLAELDGPESKVVSLLPYPECEIPGAVIAGWIGQSPQAFLHMPPYKHFAYQRAIVLWPKRHRVCLVDLTGVLTFLETRLTMQRDDDTYLGLASTYDLVLGTFPAFDAHGPAIVGAHSLPPDAAPRRFARHLPSLQRILMALNDAAITVLFLRDVVTLQNEHLSVAEVAPVVYSLLTSFGWEPLLGAMLGLVQRWIKTQPDATVQLLVSLAGLDTEAPVCRPLQQPFTAELFKRCYDAVLRTPNLFTDEFGARCGPAVVQGLILLDYYVHTTVPQLQRVSFFSRRLPPLVVAVIDAYLFAPLPVAGFLSSPDTFDPLKAVAVGLRMAMRSQPDGTAVLQGCTIHDVVDGDSDLVLSVLAVANHAHRLDAALFDTCAKLWGFVLLPVLASMPDDALPALGDLVAAYIDVSVHDLVDASTWPEAYSIDKYPTTVESDAKVGARLVVDALHLLRRFAPNNEVRFAEKWLLALPATLAALHDLLLPVVGSLDDSSDVHRLLATAALDRWTRLPPLPEVVDYAMPAHPDLDPRHCNQCHSAHGFATEPIETSRSCYVDWDGLCPDLKRVVEGDAARMRIVQAYYEDDERDRIEGPYRLEKVLQIGQVPEDEWLAHQDKRIMFARTATSIEILHSWLRHAEPKSTDTPAAKRSRWS